MHDLCMRVRTINKSYPKWREKKVPFDKKGVVYSYFIVTSTPNVYYSAAENSPQPVSVTFAKNYSCFKTLFKKCNYKFMSCFKCVCLL